MERTRTAGAWLLQVALWVCVNVFSVNSVDFVVKAFRGQALVGCVVRAFSWTLLAALVLLASAALQTRQATGVARPSHENAYRANNLGVARLEQFDYPAAVQAFRRALEIAPELTMARINLAIALYYAGDLAAAGREAEAGAKQDPALPQANYLVGLVARADNRYADAIAAFERVRRADADDVGTAINLGQLYLQQQKFTEAVEAFRRATMLEPYQATAAYGLATALLRNGAREEGAEAMSRFQKLRNSGYATTFSQNYLEQGRYAAAIASTGAEPELVNRATPDVTFENITSTALPEGAAGASAATLFDVDGDGRLDLALATGSGVTVLRNDRGRFVTFEAATALARAGSATAIVAGDYNNDERPDLLLLGPETTRLFSQQPDRSFKDATEAAALPKFTARSAAWSDADHDGDLDIVSPPYLLRNNGNGTFTDVSATSGLASVTAAIAIAPTDFDNRRDIDFLVLGGAKPTLLQNMRDGTFHDSAAAVGLSRDARWTAIASGDANKDGFVDFFLCRGDGPGVFATSDGHGKFALEDAPPATVNARAAQFLDYDNDGLLDVFVLTGGNQPILLRNLGTGWAEVSARAFPRLESTGGLTDVTGAIAAGDLDGDGDTDVVTSVGGNVRVWRNEGGSRNGSLRVQLSARVSNRSSLGARVEMRAGSLSQQIDTVSAAPAPAPADVIFGLGKRPGADVVRVLWPAGILQAEVPAEGQRLMGQTSIRELDRKPSSCPYLYTWNGSRFEFVTDFLGGGEMGYWVAPGARNTPDPDEYVRIDSTQLKPRDGRYELRVTNELEEALFLDRAELIAIDHPGETDVYPDEGMTERPKPFGLFLTRQARPPVAAVDEHGHHVLDRISAIDRRYPDDFALERVRGYAKPHALTVTLPPRPTNQRLILLLTGWTDYAFSRDNVSASQQALTLEPPSLSVKGPDGSWHTVIHDIGVPVGRPQTVTVDMTDAVPADATEVRIATNMRIYWDRVLVVGGVRWGQSPFPGTDGPKLVKVPLASASLRWRGFSAEISPDGREPFGYDYSRVASASPWKLLPGRYTREGDVSELLTGVDDMFVVSRPGDEIALSFDATSLPQLPAGWIRTFLLNADGFSKEMDPHSSSPDELEPLPFHRMTRYPYAPERYPDDEAHRRYVERYNTRVVLKSVPRIETIKSFSPQNTRNTQK